MLRRLFHARSLAAAAFLTACSGGSTSPASTPGGTTHPSTPSLASIVITPNPASVATGGTQQFTASGKDANGSVFAFTPSWSVVAGGGAISSSGLFTAGSAPGTFTNTVQAASGTVSGFASVTVTAPPPAIDASPIATGRILFAATGTTNPDDPYRLFVMNADGTGRTEITKVAGHHISPTIERLAGGGWRLAYARNNQLRTFTTTTGVEVQINTPTIGDRPSLSPDAATVAYQGGESGTFLNIWIANADGSGMPRAVTTYAPPGAEWPYFVGATKLLVSAGVFNPPHHVVAIDGSTDVAVPVPGGQTVGHASVRPDASEFLSAQNLTSFVIATGAVGTINNLKTTTTMIAQLAALGLAPIPTSVYQGQGGQGSFALSTDWSRDGTKLVFDGAVQDVTTGAIRGVATFTWDIATNKLVLIYGPEPLTPARTNNYNYSMGTPRWIP